VYMTDVQTILVIFLSGFLGLFLVLGCIVLVKGIQILNHLKIISEKAEKIADSAEHVGEFFRHTAGPAAIAKLVANIVENVFYKRKRKRGKDEQ
jgi:hypothetical protein